MLSHAHAGFWDVSRLDGCTVYNIPLKHMSTSSGSVSITIGTKIPPFCPKHTTRCALQMNPKKSEECGQWMQANALLLKLRELSDLQFLRPFDTGYSADEHYILYIYQHVCRKSDWWFWRCHRICFLLAWWCSMAHSRYVQCFCFYWTTCIYFDSGLLWYSGYSGGIETTTGIY